MSVNMMAASLRCSLPTLIGRGRVSDRRRGYRSSPFSANNLLHQRFKARLPTRVVEQWGEFAGRQEELFRRERCHNRFKARIATERGPERMKLQTAVVGVAGHG